MDTEERLAALKADVAMATQKKLRADMAAEAALKERDEALTTLRNDFGVSSVEEASRLLEKLKHKLDQQLTEAEASLGEIS